MSINAEKEELLRSLEQETEGSNSGNKPSFEGSGWLSGVKILKCNEDPSLTWVREAVRTLPNLWKDAKLEVAYPDHALWLLQRQNPEVPTSDRNVLSVAKSVNEDGGQSFILQINKAREDGMGSWKRVLRLERRHPADGNKNALNKGEGNLSYRRWRGNPLRVLKFQNQEKRAL